MQYAKWLKDELGATLINADVVKVDTLLNYDLIIYCGGIYMGRINGFSFIKNNFNTLHYKKIIAFACCSMPLTPEYEENVKKMNYSEEMKEKVPLFFAKGGIDVKKLNFFDGLIINFMKSAIMKKDDRTEDDIKMLGMVTEGKDYTSRDQLDPIIDYVVGGKWKHAKIFEKKD